MFSTMNPRITTRATLGRRIGSAITAVALGVAFAIAGTIPASAAGSDDGDNVSWAQAQFFSGSLAGGDLDTVASVEPAEAWNDGNDPTMTDKDPLEVKALDTIPIGTGESVQIETDGVQAGVLGQYASATADGQSFAAAGAILEDGGVGAGQDVSMPGADASMDLNGAVGNEFASTLTGLSLTVNAIGAQAQADGANASGDYRLDGAVLRMSSPAISQLTEKVGTALDSIDSGIGLLEGDDGALLADVNKLLQQIDPALDLLGGDAEVTATIETGDLRSLVEDLLESQYGDSGVTFDLETGVVSIDLAKAVGGNLNDLPPNTELLSSPVINQVLSTITGRVSTIADQVVDRVEDSLHDATVGIHADLDSDIAQAPLVQKVCETVKKVIQVPTQVLTHVNVLVPKIDGVLAQVVNGVPMLNGVPIVGDLVGSNLGGLLGIGHTVEWVTLTVDVYVTRYVSKTVDQVVCQNRVTELPALENSADIDITGTVDQFLNGEDVESSANIRLLGVPMPPLDLELASEEIADSLLDGLFDDDGAISDLAAALQSGLVQPAVDGLLDGDNAVETALTDVLSVKVNVQDLTDGRFTETAMQVTALGGIGGIGGAGGAGGLLGAARSAGGLSQINLAQASVGPNVLSVDDPCILNCGAGGDTTTPADSGGGGLLAMTGASIALLIAMVLALLAAGAYLVREGYRNRHMAPAE